MKLSQSMHYAQVHIRYPILKACKGFLFRISRPAISCTADSSPGFSLGFLHIPFSALSVPSLHLKVISKQLDIRC